METVKPGDKNTSARSNSRAVPSMSGRAGDDDDTDRRDVHVIYDIIRNFLFNI